MNTIHVEFATDDWVWLCQFLANTITDLGEDVYVLDEGYMIRRLLETAEKGTAILK